MTDEVIFTWAINAKRFGGSFVAAIGSAWLQADDSNRRIIRKSIEELVSKYSEYIDGKPR